MLFIPIRTTALEIKFDDILQSVVVVESSAANRPPSLGTGFYFEKNYIITNYHVIKDYNVFRIRAYNDFSIVNAKLVGYDRYTDLAILKTELPGTKFMPIIKQATRIGEEVFVVGHPFGYEFSVSKGVISSLDRYDSKYPFVSYMQTDATVQSGSSGSPVINRNGKVVGIIKATVNATVSTGLSLAITLPLVLDSIKKIKEQKIVERPSLIFISEQDALKHLVPETNLQLPVVQESHLHIYSNTTHNDSKTNVHSINGLTVSSVYEANSLIQSFMPGESVTIVYRQGDAFITQVVVLENLK